MPTKLYVGNLPFNTTENELQEMFSQAGAVQEVMLMRANFPGHSGGFAFAPLSSEQPGLVNRGPGVVGVAVCGAAVLLPVAAAIVFNVAPLLSRIIFL